jgi:hypothetical protein
MAILLATLSAVILAGAWHEYAAGNRRDAGLLIGVGLGLGVGAGAMAVF